MKEYHKKQTQHHSFQTTKTRGMVGGTEWLRQRPLAAWSIHKRKRPGLKTENGHCEVLGIRHSKYGSEGQRAVPKFVSSDARLGIGSHEHSLLLVENFPFILSHKQINELTLLLNKHVKFCLYFIQSWICKKEFMWNLPFMWSAKRVTFIMYFSTLNHKNQLLCKSTCPTHGLLLSFSFFIAIKTCTNELFCQYISTRNC